MGVAERGPRALPLGMTDDAVGLAVDDIPTPALVLDLGTAMGNIARMGERFASLPARLRPHVKAHKCAELAREQLAHGAIGVTTATVAEADAMAAAGVEDILIANQVVAPASIERLAALAARARVTVAVDDRANLEAVAAHGVAAGAPVGVVVELDVGMGRGGTRTVEDACALAKAAADLQGVELRGLLGYEGHCADEADPVARERETRASMELLTGAAERMREDGLPIEIVSAGATGTYTITGAFPGITEVQAGSYVLMDRYHARFAPEFGFALHVIATAISVHGDLVVFDAGRKALGSDFGPPASPDARGTFGFIHEEHVGYRYAGDAPYRVGDRAAFVPDYAPTTVNLFGRIHVAERGRVVNVWRVLARHGDA
jgi:D-serine deaminase-like pyridoxal phosphate-dependent protein